MKKLILALLSVTSLLATAAKAETCSSPIIDEYAGQVLSAETCTVKAFKSDFYKFTGGQGCLAISMKDDKYIVIFDGVMQEKSYGQLQRTALYSEALPQWDKLNVGHDEIVASRNRPRTDRNPGEKHSLKYNRLTGELSLSFTELKHGRKDQFTLICE